MTTIYERSTPAHLLDEEKLERNIQRMQDLCSKSQKHLWPMVKTHKSTRIALLQQKAGAEGFLTGTLDECEALVDAGIRNLMYAYPTVGAVNLDRVLRLCEKCSLILRLDGLENARAVSEAAQRTGHCLDYVIIIDSGLHRFGIPPTCAGEFAKQAAFLPGLRLRGIATHPGQVYGASSLEAVTQCAAEELASLELASRALTEAGYPPELCCTGSTPTASYEAHSAVVTHLHPGNYVFCDAMQMALGAASEKDCALSVMATIVSRPAEDRLVIDAGAKCLGLDKGAHGNSALQGYGRILGHPELLLASLSEEVGVIQISGTSPLSVGDRVRIIPNHACSAANLTAALITVRGDEVTGSIPVDFRGNSRPRF